MKIHVQVFHQFHNLYPGEWIPCWLCGATAVDIAHIDPKGMGGRPSREFIENYCPLCRLCHNKTEGKTEQKLILYPIVIAKILISHPDHKYSQLFISSPWFNLLTERHLIPSLT